MGPLVLGTIITSAIGGMSTVIVSCLRQRTANQRLIEKRRQAQLLNLPPGSHVVDLGRRGIVIDVGRRADNSKDNVNAATQ